MNMRPFILPCLTLFSTLALAQETLSLDQFLTIAVHDNLSLKMEQAKSDAFKESARGLEIPPPMVSYVQMRDQSGSTASGFEVSQNLPFPGKILANRKARKIRAQAQTETELATEAETRAQARWLYTDLWLTQQRLQALNEKKEALQSHLRLSRAQARSDSSLRIHLLKVESDLDLIDNDILQATQDISEKQAQAAGFLNQDASQFHPQLAEPPLTPLPQAGELESPHQLASFRLQYESQKARIKDGWFPDLYLRYRQVGETRMMPKTSEVMIGLTLPFLFPWEASANSGLIDSERLQSELDFKRTSRSFSNDKHILLTRAMAFKRQLDNITLKLLPRAEKRMKLVHNLAPRDMESLQDHREAMETFPELKLKALEMRSQYESTVAELEKYRRGLK